MRLIRRNFTINTVPDRMAKNGDLWAGIFEAKIDIVRHFQDLKQLKAQQGN